MGFLSEMGLPEGFFEGEYDDENFDIPGMITFGKGGAFETSLSYQACYESLGNQNFCSYNGYKLVFGVSSDDGVSIDRRCTITKDGIPLGTYEFDFHGAQYPLHGFRITLVKKSTTDFTKLLRAFDPNFEDWLKIYARKPDPSQESYWTSGDGVSYDQIRRQLVIWLFPGFGLSLTAC